MNAVTICDEYLLELAQLNINDNQTNTATIIKNIRHREEIKQSFRIMRLISKGKQGRAVSSILVLDELNNMVMYGGVSDDLGYRPAWVSIDDEDKTMSTLLRQNKPHLHQ
eukprot:11186437-Ditylum_brightwellii.AAC.1